MTMEGLKQSPASSCVAAQAECFLDLDPRGDFSIHLGQHAVVKVGAGVLVP